MVGRVRDPEHSVPADAELETPLALCLLHETDEAAHRMGDREL